METITEQEYIKAHSEYVRLLNNPGTKEEELKNARIKVDELSKRLNEMYDMEKEGCRFNPKFAKQEILSNLRLIYDQLNELDIRTITHTEKISIFKYFLTGLQEGYRTGIASFSKIQPPVLNDDKMPSIYKTL